MAERIWLHPDENVDPVIAAALRRHGIDVTTTIEMGLRAASDDEQPEFIKDSVSTDQIIRSLALIYEVLDPEEMVGRVEFL